MVEIDKTKLYKSDEPIHQGYRAGADKTYFEIKKQNEDKKKAENFIKGLAFVRQYIGKSKKQ